MPLAVFVQCACYMLLGNVKLVLQLVTLYVRVKYYMFCKLLVNSMYVYKCVSTRHTAYCSHIDEERLGSCDKLNQI